jgi:hypothetical protein
MKKSLVLRVWSLVRVGPFVLSATVAMLWATAAQATEAAISCQEAGSLKGPITDIVVTMGRYRHSTGQPEGRISVEQDLHFSEDRRTLTITTHEMDVPGQPFPRSICEFDLAGRLVKDVLLLDGSNPFTTVEFEYDGAGRLSKSTSKSQNPEFNRTLLYEYGDRWRSERFISAVASVLTMTTLDDEGRPIKEVKSDERSGANRSTVEYSYTKSQTVTCATESSGARWCGTETLDSHGNRAEFVMPAFGSLPASHAVERYEYDSYGNWVVHVTVSNISTEGSDTGHAIWRKMTYR